MVSTIRQSVTMIEAIACNQSIFEYKPKSNVGKDYEAFCKEVIKRIGITKPRRKRVE